MKHRFFGGRSSTTPTFSGIHPGLRVLNDAIKPLGEVGRVKILQPQHSVGEQWCVWQNLPIHQVRADADGEMCDIVRSQQAAVTVAENEAQ